MPTLRTTEAAVVAAVEVTQVNRVLDERVLPVVLYDTSARDRTLAPWACPFMSFYFEAAGRLTAEERREVIREAVETREIEPMGEIDPTAAMTFQRDYLTVDLAPFVQRAARRLKDLREAQAMVETRPDILAGSTPVIRGTRIPVYDVATALRAATPEQVAEDYPSLDARRIQLARLYAEAAPPRGRPRRLHAERPLASLRVPRARAVR